MPVRKTAFVPNEYYHIFNRSNDKQPIFLDAEDWARFLFSIIYLQSDMPIFNISSKISNFIKHRVFNISKKTAEKILKNRSVELVNFSLMPNHFHATVKESKENGVSNYMQRSLNSFAKYFNAKYKRSGHLFQGPFKAVHINDNNQLLYLSAYIHRNSREIKQWKRGGEEFPWSSYQDYTVRNRWEKFLKPEIITEQISFGKEYRYFVESSTAKLFENELGEELML